MLKNKLIFFLLSLFLVIFQKQVLAEQIWSTKQINILKSLWIKNLDILPDDHSNNYSENPTAVNLGHRIFFDKITTCFKDLTYFDIFVSLGISPIAFLPIRPYARNARSWSKYSLT